MKGFKNLGLIIFSFIVVVTIGCGNDKSHDSETEEHVPVEINTENLTIVDYSIEGMVCAMGCAATIQEEVIGMTGVAVSHVDYEAEQAHFEYDPAITSEKEIIAKIESIADGQYKVNEWVEPSVEESVEEEEGNSENEESLTEVKLPSFEVPNLFTLILDQL